MPFASVNGLNLFYEERGQGPGLVFLNGLSGDHMYWKTQLRAFSKRYRCLALENRDVGQSTYVEREYGISDVAADAVVVMEQLNFGRSHVLGLSMGGMIAQELILARPDLVQSLVLVDTMARADAWFHGLCDTFALLRRQAADTPSFFEGILPWWVGSKFFAESARAEWLKWLLKQSPYPQKQEGFLRQIEAMRRHDALDRISSIRCPVLILSGEEDAIMPVRYARQMKEAMPHAELQIVAETGHGLPLELGREFDGRIRKFLDTLN